MMFDDVDCFECNLDELEEPPHCPTINSYILLLSHTTALRLALYIQVLLVRKRLRQSMDCLDNNPGTRLTR
jgi:hypothetical protein